MSEKIIIDENSKNERLDKYLVKYWPNYSRTQIQQAIKNGLVLINDKKTTVHHFLKTGDVIAIHDNPKQTITASLKPVGGLKYEIVSQTNDYLIINKPAGLIVHPGDAVTEPTLIEGLVNDFPEIQKVGEDKLRPGIVHRLDKEVSGLMIVTRNQTAFEYFKNQFQTRQILKEYLGLVVGKVETPSGVINIPIARSKSNRHKMAAQTNADDKAKEAITHYEVLHNYQQTTLLKLTLETGRTHQIRTHLNALGYPLVGDTVYRPKKIVFKSNPGRIFLHSHHLRFMDLNNYQQDLVCPLPPELDNFLKKLV